MDLDLQWLLIGLPVAFALGWMASRFDLRQLRRERQDSPRAYFKGLNLLLNEQQDRAIDTFIEAVQNDPDTTELHFALGNLFRRRGESWRSRLSWRKSKRDAIQPSAKATGRPISSHCRSSSIRGQRPSRGGCSGPNSEGISELGAAAGLIAGGGARR